MSVQALAHTASPGEKLGVGAGPEKLIATHILSGAKERLTFKIFESYTHGNSERQLRYELEESRTLLMDTHISVLIGRDLDFDGFMDTWFPLTVNDVPFSVTSWTTYFPSQSSGTSKSIDRVSKRKDGWDAAFSLMHELGIHNRSMTQLVFDSIPSIAFISDSLNSGFKDGLLARQLNVLSLEKRVANLIKEEKIDGHEQLALYQAISNEWMAIADDISNIGLPDAYKGVAGDMSFQFLGGVILKSISLLGPVLKPVFSKMSIIAMAPLLKTSTGRALYSRCAAYYASVNLAREQAAARLARIKSGQAIVARYAATRGATISTLKRVHLYNQAIIARQVTAKVLQAWWADKGYVAFNFSIQTAIEAQDHWDEIKDPNPFKIAQNIWNNREMRQNLLFMFSETNMQTVVHTSMGRNMKSYVTCFFLSMGNSVATNIWIKKESDPGRIAGDTLWETTIGNGQTLADGVVRQHAKELAKQTGNSKFRLLGYAFVVIDQSAGYLGYNKWTGAYEDYRRRQKEKLPKLEQSKIQDQMPITSDAARHLEPMLIPIMVPAGI
ncbi:MAG: hypothetical protein SGI74_06005 [Oligoflexia bacterium]|nr:hypothetical protein [Oligoflexia bacterium]